MNKHEAILKLREAFDTNVCPQGFTKNQFTELKNYFWKLIKEAEATEKAYEELQDDVGVLLRVLDAPIEEAEAKYILDQICIKLSKVGNDYEK